jgi:hypothetical protein
MITVNQLDKNLTTMLDGWFTKFEPLYTAVTQEKLDMEKRIFGTGNKGGTNTAGAKLPTTAYSVTPIYVSPKDVRNAPAKFKKGKPNKDGKRRNIESLYFPFGYAQLKTETSARLPLQLVGSGNGGLLASFFNTPTGEDGLTCAIEIGTEQVGKIEGLEAKYGIIFLPTEEEEQAMLNLHTELIIEQINKQFNG